MIKYRITIEKIEEKPVIKSVYISSEELAERGEGKTTDNYRDVERVETVKEEIYEQTVENQIDLKGIIDAFNKQPLGGGPTRGSEFQNNGGGGGSNT